MGVYSESDNLLHSDTSACQRGAVIPHKGIAELVHLSITVWSLETGGLSSEDRLHTLHDTVEPIFWDHPLVHQTVVSEDKWSLIRGQAVDIT